ncbi:MAG: glutaredoxin [Sphingomonadaceae bacterium]
MHPRSRTFAVPRPILDERRIHPAIREKVATLHAGIVREVQQAVTENAVVVVGMRHNPHVRRARRALDAAGISHRYLEYGSYATQWRRRNALKMWTGWPTFPMVFVRGVLVGGASDLVRIISGNELAGLLTKQPDEER